MDVRFPFAGSDPFEVLAAFADEADRPPAPAPLPPPPGLQPGRPAPDRSARRGRIVSGLAAAAVLLLAVSAVATSGPAGALVVVGLALLLTGLGAVVVGRARWAFIASRRAGGAVLAAGLVATVAGGAGVPPAEPTAAASPAAVSTAPVPAPAAEDGTTAEAEPERAETDEAVVAAVDPATGLLSDGATAAAVDGAAPATALAALSAVPVQGRAPRSGYDRDLFGSGWVDTDRNGCDTRNDVLARDLTGETFTPGTRDCVVLDGTLDDPYSGTTMAFRRGQDTSDDVQIDHVVALSDAWQKGAQGWDPDRRTAFANDPLGLLAVDGPLNMQKGDGDAATWLPPDRSYRCAYVARQVAVKVRYGLWMTPAERNAIATVLSSCPAEPLPGGVVAPNRQSSASAPAPAPAPVPVPAPAPAPAPAPEPAPTAYYANCDAVRAAGAAPIRPGDPGWQPKFDRDGDGVGCEA